MPGFGMTMNVEPAEVKVIPDEQVLPDGSTNLLKTNTEQAGDVIGRYVQGTLFPYYRDARRNEQEDICLDCERAYNNKYNLAQQKILAERQAESGDSTVWVPYTRTKVNIAVAKTYEKMLNSSDTPWSIVPEQVSQRELDMNQQYIDLAVMQGILKDDPKRALQKMNDLSEKEAIETCDKMEKEIADQLNKGKAGQQIAKTLLQQHYLGTGISKIEIAVDTEEKWEETPNGWELIKKERPFPMWKFVSWFEIFFDPYAKSKEESNGVIQRRVTKRSDLKSLKKAQGFDEAAIDLIITQNPEGNHIDLDYETTIRAVNDQDQNVQKNDNYFDVYEAWVELPGDKMIEYGYNKEKIEPTQAYMVNCWVCANITIKLIMNPHSPQKIPYFIVPYEENTSTINGTGISEDLFGVQEVLNSVTRAAVDNGAFSHAPITEVNVDLLKSGETPPSVLRPRGIYLREGGDPKEPMMRFHNIPENSGVLYNLFELFSKIGEDATGIASSTEESMPSANTANLGISMALSQKNILQRSVVGNIDMYLYQPMIEMFYNFNMQWNARNDIKHPAKVTANGVTSIIAKEMRSQQLMAFAELTNNPEDRTLVDRKEVLEGLATSLDQNGEKLIYSDIDADERKKDQGESIAQAAQAEQQGVIGQINAENQGELEQIRVKGTIDRKKQELVNFNKLQAIALKEEADITKQEMDLIKQMRTMAQQQQNTERNTMQQQNNTERSAMQQNEYQQQQPAGAPR